MMRKIIVLAASLASIAGFAFALHSHEVRATELEAMAGASITLGDVSGSAHYTVEPDGYRVEATVASGVDNTPVRLTATLLSGQKVTVSVPRGIGEPEMKIEFNRIEDRLFVNDASKLPNLAH
jgi:hypothetical protein